MCALVLLLAGCGSVGLVPFADDPSSADARLRVDPQGEVLFPPALPTGQGVEQELTLQAVGEGQVVVEDIYVMGEDAASFQLGDIALPWKLDSGVERPVRVWFGAQAVGQYTAVLVMETPGQTTVSVSRKLVGQVCADDDRDGSCDPTSPEDSGW